MLTQRLFVLVLLLGVGTRADNSGLDDPFSSSFAKLDHAACVSLFYRNGRVGCGTLSHSVQKGKLIYYNKGELPNIKSEHVIVMEEYELTADSVGALYADNDDGLLQGILVLNSTSSSSGSNNGGNDNDNDEQTFYSPEARTPLGYNTPSAGLNYGYISYPWNNPGTGLLQLDLYGLPIALVKESSVSESLREEAIAALQEEEKYSNMNDNDASSSVIEQAHVVAEFNYYMGPDNVASPDCLAWKNVATDEWAPKCLPLGGMSVWASAGSPPNPQKNNGNNNNNKNNKKPVVVLAAGMDSTSLFHDLSPGANSAASNILTVMMAAKLIGSNMDDETLDGLTNRIVIALFQGETYGFLGSRAFLRDVAYPGFKCYGDPVASPRKSSSSGHYVCLNPLRPDLDFSGIGQIVGMLSVDQLGHTLGDGNLYVHADSNNNNYAKFLVNALKYSKTSSMSVQSSSIEYNNNYGFAYPPSPLTSLLQLSGGAVAGAVLTAYDMAFTNSVPYHSHRDSASLQSISLDAIAAAATIAARGIVAAAYDNGGFDYATSSTYAANLIPELSSDDETLVALADCLLYDGNCDMINEYSKVERANEISVSGLNVGMGYSLGTPPSYYVGVYGEYSGQPFLKVGDSFYGAYDVDVENDDLSSIKIGMTPRQLESTLYGMMNDFLGRGSVSKNNNGNGDLHSCNRIDDCKNVDYCGEYNDSPTCTGGGVCVCKRAHYHIALDEALIPAAGEYLGFFKILDDDQGASPMYTEPYWSPSVNVRVYRQMGWLPGVVTLVAGAAISATSFFAAFVLKVGLKKQKLY